MIQAYIFDFKPFYACSIGLCLALLQANTDRNRRVQSYYIHHTPEWNCQKKDARMNNFPSVQIFDLFYFWVTSFLTKNFGSKICPKTRPKNAPILEFFQKFFTKCRCKASVFRHGECQGIDADRCTKDSCPVPVFILLSKLTHPLFYIFFFTS